MIAVKMIVYPYYFYFVKLISPTRESTDNRTVVGAFSVKPIQSMILTNKVIRGKGWKYE